METTSKVYFNIGNLGLYGAIPDIEDAMKEEFIRVFKIYADICNSGVTNKLNGEFDKLYPNYHKDNRKEWHEITEYNKFMADGYQRLVVDKFNEMNISPILNFYVDPESTLLIGYLKVDRKATIYIYMIES